MFLAQYKGPGNCKAIICTVNTPIFSPGQSRLTPKTACSVAPQVSLTFGSQTYAIKPVDFSLPVDNTGETCAGGAPLSRIDCSVVCLYLSSLLSYQYWPQQWHFLGCRRLIPGERTILPKFHIL